MSSSSNWQGIITERRRSHGYTKATETGARLFFYHGYIHDVAVSVNHDNTLDLVYVKSKCWASGIKSWLPISKRLCCKLRLQPKSMPVPAIRMTLREPHFMSCLLCVLAAQPAVMADHQVMPTHIRPTSCAGVLFPKAWCGWIG